MFTNLLENIDYKFEKDNFTQYLREEAAKWLCILSDAKCRKNATFELEKDLENSVQNK